MKLVYEQFSQRPVGPQLPHLDCPRKISHFLFRLFHYSLVTYRYDYLYGIPPNINRASSPIQSWGMFMLSAILLSESNSSLIVRATPNIFLRTAPKSPKSLCRRGQTDWQVCFRVFTMAYAWLLSVLCFVVGVEIWYAISTGVDQQCGNKGSKTDGFMCKQLD